MDISVVLCTYNSAERLRETLEAFCTLASPEGREWELVLVDNNSTDHTERVAEALSDQLPLTYVFESNQGKSNALNAGLGVAQGDLIVFTDDDVTPAPDWVDAYWKAYQERPEGYYFGGPIESEHEAGEPDADLLRAAFASVSGLNYGSEARELPPEGYFVGANWACPAHHLEQVGAFDESIGIDPETGGAGTGEDMDMMSRLEKRGLQGWYVPGAKLTHFVPESKATLEHIVHRNTAGLQNRYSNGAERPTTLFGMPLGLYKEAARRFTEWMVRRATGRQWKAEYVAWRVWAERVKAYHGREA